MIVTDIPQMVSVAEKMTAQQSYPKGLPAVPTKATISPGMVVCSFSLAEQPKSPSFNLSLATKNMLAPESMTKL